MERLRFSRHGTRWPTGCGALRITRVAAGKTDVVAYVRDANGNESPYWVLVVTVVPR